MAGKAAAPPLGTVIENQDGSHSIWNGKQFAPARQDAAGNWGVDNDALTRMGLAGAGNATPLTADDQKRVSAMQGDFDNANGLADTAADFMQRNARTPTGGLWAVPGAPTVGSALGIGGPDIGAMNRDNNQMAVQMRAPGMRLTQMEFGKFLGATPSVKNTQGNNAGIAEDIYRARTLAAAKSSFYSTWLNVHRSLAGADGAWMNFQSQHFSPDLSTYYHDPAENPALKRQMQNTALKAKGPPSVLEPGDYLK